VALNLLPAPKGEKVKIFTIIRATVQNQKTILGAFFLFLVTFFSPDHFEASCNSPGNSLVGKAFFGEEQKKKQTASYENISPRNLIFLSK